VRRRYFRGRRGGRGELSSPIKSWPAAFSYPRALVSDAKCVALCAAGARASFVRSSTPPVMVSPLSSSLSVPPVAHRQKAARPPSRLRLPLPCLPPPLVSRVRRARGANVVCLCTKDIHLWLSAAHGCVNAVSFPSVNSLKCPSDKSIRYAE